METNNIVALASFIRNASNAYIEKELERNNIVGIVPAHGSILKILFGEREGIPMKKLVEKTGKAKSTITSNMATLMKYGFIRKQQDPADARSQLITLTDEGKSIEGIFETTSEKLLSMLYRDVSVDEQQRVVEILGKICHNLK